MCSPVRKPPRWVVFLAVISVLDSTSTLRTTLLAGFPVERRGRNPGATSGVERSAGSSWTNPAGAHPRHAINPLKATADAGERQPGSDDAVYIAQNRGISMA